MLGYYRVSRGVEESIGQGFLYLDQRSMLYSSPVRVCMYVCVCVCVFVENPVSFTHDERINRKLTAPTWKLVSVIIQPPMASGLGDSKGLA